MALLCLDGKTLCFGCCLNLSLCWVHLSFAVLYQTFI